MYQKGKFKEKKNYKKIDTNHNEEQCHPFAASEMKYAITLFSDWLKNLMIIVNLMNNEPSKLS